MLDIRKVSLIAGLAIALLVMVVASQFLSDEIQSASLVLSIGGLGIMAANWHAQGDGRNGSFLFLVLGYIFLCGRAFPALWGGDSSLAEIGYTEGFNVAPNIVMDYVVLVLASFFFIHLGSLLPRQMMPTLSPLPADAKIYRTLFLLFLPALIYKNVYYFNYIMSHGGYLAIYQDSDHIEGVGFFARAGALLCLSSFTLYFFHETDRKKAGRALVFFLLVFATELLVGLRGKFFVAALVFFLMYKLRFGGKFSWRGLLAMLGPIIVIAVLVEVMREQKGESIVTGTLLTGFLAQQGVSAGVSLVVLDDLTYFAGSAWSYFWHQFLVPFYSQPEVPQGWFLANDISMKVMPDAYAAGFGTGSSYLAELFLLGGWAGVCAGSLLIGWLLSIARYFYQGVAGAVVFWIVCGVVYYPRTMLQEPVHNLFRYAAPIILLAVFCVLVRRWRFKEVK
jgi:O-antigen polysaccharide polymerase Wzy